MVWVKPYGILKLTNMIRCLGVGPSDPNSKTHYFHFVSAMILICWHLPWMMPDRVMEFCNNNDLRLIVRAHECVMDGFERFAQGHSITLFSATNCCPDDISLVCSLRSGSSNMVVSDLYDLNADKFHSKR
ncbi:Serine/threonine-protein phosphatase BSL3 [Glycine soja]